MVKVRPHWLLLLMTLTGYNLQYSVEDLAKLIISFVGAL